MIKRIESVPAEFAGEVRDLAPRITSHGRRKQTDQTLFDEIITSEGVVLVTVHGSDRTSVLAHDPRRQHSLSVAVRHDGRVTDMQVKTGRTNRRTSTLRRLLDAAHRAVSPRR